MSKSTPTDVLNEYYWLFKNIPNLVNNELSDILIDVKTNLKIEHHLEIKRDDKMNIKGDKHPILDALSCKLGYSVKNWIAPPTVDCLLCEKKLMRNNKRLQVVLFTQMGPEMATKYIWECQSCTGTFAFNNKFQDKNRVYYYVDSYGNPDMGFKKYKPNLKVNVTRC